MPPRTEERDESMYKVMLIDDEENLQEAIERLLVQGGYAFCGARDAESCLLYTSDAADD